MTRQTEPQQLTFADEPGSARSKWVAAILVVGLILWLGSGYVFPAPPESTATAAQQDIQPVAVGVRDSQAQTVTQIFSAEGQAQPDRRTTLRNQTAGTVAELAARKGALLDQGAVIARLGTREQEARIAQAEQDLARAQREFDNAQTLLNRGVATQDRLTEARSTLASAETALTTAEEALEDTVIRAPFAGRLDALDLDRGEFVPAGTEIGTMLDTDPLTIVIQVPQQALSRISAGQRAEIGFITGQEAEGEVAYVSADADSTTRTFRAEITVPNGDGAIASGLSANVRIPTGELAAHFVSPAILSLSADGRLGVKAVGPDDHVVFHDVTIERAQTDGVWVSGLPDAAQLITIGQGFVSDGERVNPQPDADRNTISAITSQTADAAIGSP